MGEKRPQVSSEHSETTNPATPKPFVGFGRSKPMYITSGLVVVCAGLRGIVLSCGMGLLTAVFRWALHDLGIGRSFFVANPKLPPRDHSARVTGAVRRRRRYDEGPGNGFWP